MSPTKLCGRFGVPWRTGCDKRTGAAQNIDPRLASSIKDTIEQGLALRRLHDRRVVRASPGTRCSGLVFIIRHSTDVVRSHCLEQRFVIPLRSREIGRGTRDPDAEGTLPSSPTLL
nr:hypothetical protein DWF04_18555 [Cereibacter sphaeroides f. sp. denitrificans]